MAVVVDGVAAVDSGPGDSVDVDSHGCSPDLGSDVVAATEALADVAASATEDAVALVAAVDLDMVDWATVATVDTATQATPVTIPLVTETTAHKLDIRAATVDLARQLVSTVDLVQQLASTVEMHSAQQQGATVAFAMEALHALLTLGQD